MGKKTKSTDEHDTSTNKYIDTLFGDDKDNQEYNNDIDFYQENEQDDMDDIVFDVQTNLIEYCKTNALDLCEYLDHANIENYIRYVLENRS